MALLAILIDIFHQPTIGDVVRELMILISPLWIAVFIGVLLGWSWKPKWANFTMDFTSISTFNLQLPPCTSWILDDKDTSSSSSMPDYSYSLSEEEQVSGMVNQSDLKHLSKLVDGKDGGPDWIQMMDRSTQTMSYKAWRRDPATGPPQYRSQTVYEDCTPEMMRDFFWDDEFRLKWDDMLIYAKTVEESATTGTMVVQWVRKFPFFCSDREYILGRRIWESRRSYYCVTKGVPYPSVPRRNKPRRVDLYYSSWLIRAVESKKGDGQLTACEVVLFHHEDMGIPWEIAKLGVRQGMWGAVKKIDPGLRLYQKKRESDEPLSQCAYMSQINTKVSPDYIKFLENSTNIVPDDDDDDDDEEPNDSCEKTLLGRRSIPSIPKLVVAGGALALACSLDQGLLTKALIFGVARRFAKIVR